MKYHRSRWKECEAIHWSRIKRGTFLTSGKKTKKFSRVSFSMRLITAMVLTRLQQV